MLNEKSVAGTAAVVGAGVMGSGIAALLANVGWRVLLLDRVPDDAGNDRKSRNRLAQEGLDRALKARPPQLGRPDYAARITVGNMEDDLERAGEALWIVEAVAEDLPLKRRVLSRIAEAAGDNAVISSNTSGLSLAGMVADCPAGFRRRFFGTHFFNPPRYMKPLELIPTAETDPELLEAFARFADRVLGKRVIRARDTPGFISTRLGMYALCKTLEIACDRGLTVEEADYLTGPLIGRPRTGTFRLADVIGLDITARIADNLREALPGDSAYQALRIPDAMRGLIADGRIGAKTGAGFYRRADSGEIQSLDLQTLEYRPRIEPAALPPEITVLPLKERLVRLVALREQPQCAFAADALLEGIRYMANVTPEVAERIVDVDDAIIGGFGWELGPFHTLDAVRGAEPRIALPAELARALQFYSHQDGRHLYFDFRTGEMAELERSPDVIVLKDLKRAGKSVEESGFGSLVDLGDGAACLEWRTKMNLLSPELLDFIARMRERAEREFAALVVGGSGEHFCAGFDLYLFAAAIEAGDWQRIDSMLARFQEVNRQLAASLIPVVAAVYGYTLGGGCEVMLHCAEAQASFESSIGLPEANVGLVPAGGGCLQMLRRASAQVPPGTALERSDPFPFLRPLWENLRLARFSSSAPEAESLGYLREEDGISIHPDRLLHDAKLRALALVDSYHPAPEQRIPVMGEDGLARFRWEIHLLQRGQQITEHDARIADRLAYILTGGALIHAAEVPESRIRELEREAFLSLAATPETAARIRHMLSAGKPLRN